MQGWECPKCNKIYSPSMKECESCNKVVATKTQVTQEHIHKHYYYPFSYPYYPFNNYPQIGYYSHPYCSQDHILRNLQMGNNYMLSNQLQNTMVSTPYRNTSMNAISDFQRCVNTVDFRGVQVT